MMKGKLTNDDLLRELLSIARDSLIVNLRLAGVGQQGIREIVGGDIVRVNRIAKILKNRRKMDTP